MTLYEINQTRLDFLNKIESGEIPEEAISDTLEALDGDFNDKADDIACYIKSLLSEAQAIKSEADSLTERANAKKGKAESLTNYLYQQFKARGKDKLETTRNVLKIRKNPSSLQIDDEDSFLEFAKNNGDRSFYLDQKPKINKPMVKDWLKSGHEYPHAQLVAGEKLSIK